MLIRYGYELTLNCSQQTPMMCLLDERPEYAPALRYQSPLVTSPALATHGYIDEYGNSVRRLVAPVGDLTIFRNAIIEVSDAADPVALDAPEIPIEKLPDECLVFLFASRYCETDKLGDLAWSLFGHTPQGWARVQAICDFVNAHLTFGYEYARPTRTALEAYEERVGVCRDFAHLAVAFCRCMNIPARYVNGFLGDIGVPPDPSPMDYNAWFEVYLGGRWYVFDARHNIPRIGRITVARGRDAMDVPLATSFGRHELKHFKVWTDEVDGGVLQEAMRLSA
ncbi:MAG: transglutaminase-like domain-containing protein [Methylovirgula sp.]